MLLSSWKVDTLSDNEVHTVSIYRGRHHKCTCAAWITASRLLKYPSCKHIAHIERRLGLKEGASLTETRRTQIISSQAKKVEPETPEDQDGPEPIICKISPDNKWEWF